MSTIEKAMRKLGGGADDDGRSGSEEPVAQAAPTDTPARTAESLEEIPSPPLQSEVAVVSAAQSQCGAGAGSSREVTRPGLKIDFARLRDLGFLSPGDPTTRLSEEFQEIKRKLIANMLPGANPGNAPPNLIMVTSSVPGEGKTFTSLNLALSLALEIDRTVLAVDIDILTSDLSRLFGAYNRTGLYDYLAHPDLDVSDVIMRTNVPSLTFIPAGTIREGITERLASQAMFNLTRELAARYPDRIIIFDAPPVLATSGASALAPMIGQVVLVVEAYSTTQENLRASLNALERTQVAGIVLNKIRHRAVGRAYGGNYGFGYGNGYGQARPETDRPGAR